MPLHSYALGQDWLVACLSDDPWHAMFMPCQAHHGGQNSLGSMAHVLLITGVVEMTYVTEYYLRKGVQPMVARLHLLCLGLGILSTVMGCAAPPPPMAPLRATLSPAAPSTVTPPAPADVPPAVTPLPYVPPSTTTGTRSPDVYQPSPYERKMDKEERDGSVLDVEMD